MKKDIEEIRRNRNELLKISLLVIKLDQFNGGLISAEELEKELMFYGASYFNLPSGRKGNVIALALELNLYIAANHIIKNTDMNLDSIAIDDDKKEYGVKEELDLSLRYKARREDLELVKNLPMYNALQREYLLNEAAITLIMCRIESEKCKKILSI